MISFVKMVSFAASAAAVSQVEPHPLATVPEHVESVMHDGNSGFSMRLHPKISDNSHRQQSSFLKRKRMHKAQRESWPTQLA